MGRKGIVEG